VEPRQIWWWDYGATVDLGEATMGAWRAADVGMDLVLGLG